MSEPLCSLPCVPCEEAGECLCPPHKDSGKKSYEPDPKPTKAPKKGKRK